MNPELQAKQRSEVYAVHRAVNRANFAPDGRWIGEFPRDQVEHSREFLWHAIAFLAGDSPDVALGNALIRRTPDVNNHFNPIVAAEIALRYRTVLEAETFVVLLRILNDGLAEAVDFALASSGLNNFTAMRAFLFLAAGQLLETYDVPYAKRSIPEVYNRFRLRQFGVNVLQLLENQLERTDLAQEFNSPNYSPLTLWAMAEIVNLIEHEPARSAAERIERRLWKELLAFHHPRLRHLGGPYSRAYLNDTVGHASHWKLICAFLGIDGEAAVRDLVYTPRKGQIHVGNDLFHIQSLTCWLLRADYHVPVDLWTDFQDRAFPYEVQGRYAWSGTGFRRRDGKVVLNVEGDFSTPGGQGWARCHQEEYFSLGTMSRTYSVQNHPCQIVYRLTDEKMPVGATRAIAANLTVFRPPDFVADPLGRRAPPSLLPNHGDFEITQRQATVEGLVRPFPWAMHLRPDGSDEISFNLFISEHLPLNHPVEDVRINAARFEGDPLAVRGEQGLFTIEDGKIRVECRVRSAIPMVLRISRHGGFVRCAAVAYEGPSRIIPPDELKRSVIYFNLTVQSRRIDAGEGRA